MIRNVAYTLGLLLCDPILLMRLPDCNEFLYELDVRLEHGEKVTATCVAVAYAYLVGQAVEPFLHV